MSDPVERLIRKTTENRGRGSEALTAYVLEIMQNEEQIAGFRAVEPFSAEDFHGIDFWVKRNDGVCLPLQVKSSMTGAEKHLYRHPEIPVVVVRPGDSREKVIEALKEPIARHRDCVGEMAVVLEQMLERGVISGFQKTGRVVYERWPEEDDGIDFFVFCQGRKVPLHVSLTAESDAAACAANPRLLSVVIGSFDEETIDQQMLAFFSGYREVNDSQITSHQRKSFGRQR